MPLVKTYRHYVFAFDATGVSHADLGELRQMIRGAVEIWYRGFAAQCDVHEWAVEQEYETDSRQGLTLKDNPSVTFRQSTWRGERCYFIRRNGVEFVWMPRHHIHQKARAHLRS